jgi:2,3,4,5-tetrahydropyridine-2-carboxylate N-succinyltransferase
MNIDTFLSELENGTLRAAEKKDGIWITNTEVKQNILEAFKAGRLETMQSYGYEGFVDKHTIPPRSFQPEQGVRLVPGGSSVRRGSYVAKGVIIMPPAYINIGAYVDEGSMIDSNCLVGSCAQIGKNVHLSAGVQIGGVLEPIGNRPVVIEDNCFIGAGAIIVEGIVVETGAVIAPGVTLSRGIPIYDCVNQKLLPLQSSVPANAVVIPGTRPFSEKNIWAKEMNLQMQCALIIKYRDEKTSTSLILEDILR